MGSLEDVGIRSEASEGSSIWSESRVDQKFSTSRSASTQRYHSKHTRHLPSRTIAVLGKSSNSHLRVVNPRNLSPSPVGSASQIEDNAETIANHLEMQDDLMQNDPLSEMRRLEALRDMPQCLTVKRSIRAKLTRSVELKGDRRVLTRWKRLNPPLSLVMVVKMTMTFYIKKFGLMRHCEPPSTSWRAAQTQTLFLALAFLGMTGALTALGWVITSVKSSSCGPFRDYDYTWHAIIEEVLSLGRSSKLWIFVESIGRPGVGAALLIAMIMTVYCLRAKAQASRELVQILREMLVLQSRDKDFLLNEFSKVADEEWLKRRAANENRRSVMSPRKSVCHNQKDASSPSCSKNYVRFDDEY
ncbi:transmembrane channel-like protein 5 isoform X2 [Fopius arisanus]|uniref:Transmembrane channel-like protein 5 isoform X2 n=1 Tax=Fopius arisanus TaxID=64838 RepID=A0A9R1SYU5_9HYME|nr:PREDICTED: transmembrane channel-like protein 5 isoform X2 [Fopius arisanus]